MATTSLAKEVRTLVLVGRTGNGKSATGNNILGKKVFTSKSGASGVTSVCKIETTDMKDGPIINVIDTPGLFDGTTTAAKEIVKCINMAKDGIHAIVLVLSLKNRVTDEEKATFLTIKALFGDKIVDYMLVLFTARDELEYNEQTFEDYLGLNGSTYLQDIMRSCGNRIVLFNNRADQNQRIEQVQHLLSLVDTILSHNDRQPFTNELFIKLKEQATQAEKAETSRMKRQLKRRYVNELKKMTEMMESKLKEETTKIMKMLEEEKIARLKAEENYRSLQTSSHSEIQKLKWELANSRSKLCAIL